MWGCVKSESGLWTVGFYDPSGKWHPVRDFDNQTEAELEVHWLNGGNRWE